MSSEDFSYYSKRIADEQARAAEAPTAEIAAVHEKLAHLYRSLTERMVESLGTRIASLVGAGGS